LARDIAKRYNGQLKDAKDLPIPKPEERLYQRLKRVLRRYDDQLTPAERTFMTIFSAFRIPVHESADFAILKLTEPVGHQPLLVSLAESVTGRFKLRGYGQALSA
jgi:hypothetical protein